MDLLEWLKDGFQGIVDKIIDVLPTSPIVYLASSPKIKEVMGYVNFFIPIYTMIGLVEAWLIAIVVYYVLVVILRWLKVVE